MACSARPSACCGVEPAVQAVAVISAAGLDQPPAQRALLDDLDVGVDPAEVGQVDVEGGEVGEAAHRLERLPLLELRLQRAQVDLDLASWQVEHRLVERAGGARSRSPRPAAGPRSSAGSARVEQDRGRARRARTPRCAAGPSARGGARSSVRGTVRAGSRIVADQRRQSRREVRPSPGTSRGSIGRAVNMPDPSPEWRNWQTQRT